MPNLLDLPRALNDGLVMRWATPADAQEIATFNSIMHSDNDQIDMSLHDWTLEMLSGAHPSVKAHDFTVVVDTNAGNKIVSTMNLMSQQWTYDDLPFGVGRPEAVATHPDYRRNGLIRQQFEVIHALSATRGELVQVIGGIPHYYLQFGYARALDQSGGRHLSLSAIKPLGKDETEMYRLRLATTADIPILTELYAIHCRSSMISGVRDEAHWRWELAPRTSKSFNISRYHIIEDDAGAAVGYLRSGVSGLIYVREFAVLPDQPFYAVAHFVCRVLRGELETSNADNKTTHSTIYIALRRTAHPLYAVLDEKLEAVREPYKWFVRVPDLPAFLRHIRPVLDTRVANSPMRLYTGTLRLTFYNETLTFVFERGQLRDIGTYAPKATYDADAAFPDLTFLHLLFGNRSLSELRHADADCFVNGDHAAPLLTALFPTKASNVSAVD